MGLGSSWRGGAVCTVGCVLRIAGLSRLSRCGISRAGATHGTGHCVRYMEVSVWAIGCQRTAGLTLSIALTVASILQVLSITAMLVGALLTWAIVFAVAWNLLPSCGNVGTTAGGGEGATMRPLGVCILELGGCQWFGCCCQMLLNSPGRCAPPADLASSSACRRCWW